MKQNHSILIGLVFLLITAQSIWGQESDRKEATARFNNGVRLIEDGAWEAAVEIFEVLTEEFPNRPDPFYFLGLGLFRSGRFESSETALQEALRINPKHLQAQLELASLYESTQRFEDALVAYRKFIEIDPQGDLAEGSQFQILKIEGLMKARAGNYDEALRKFKEAAEMDPKDFALQNNIGLVYLRLNKDTQAEQGFLKAVALNPQFQDAYSNLGDMYKRNGFFKNALDAYRQAAKINETNAIGRYAISHLPFFQAMVSMQENRFDEALSMFDEALKVFPEKDKIYFNIGRIHLNRRKLEDAEAAFKLALKGNPQHQRAMLNLGVVREQQGRMEEAQSDYEAARDLSPESELGIAAAVSALTAKGRIAVKADKLDEAEEAFQMAVELQPENGGIHFNLGFIYFKNKKMELAEKSFERAIMFNPEESDAYMALASIREGGDSREEAIALYEKVVSIGNVSYVNRAQSKIHYLNGFTFLKNEDVEGASKEFEKAIEVNPKEFLAYMALASILEQEDRDKEAIAQYEKVMLLAQDPFGNLAKSRIHLLKGITFAQEEDFEAAQAEFELAIESNTEDGSIYLNLGLVHKKKKDLLSAVEVFKKGIEVDPDHRNLRFMLAKFLSELERPTEAYALYQGLLTEEEDDPFKEEVQRRSDKLFGSLNFVYEMTYDSNPFAFEKEDAEPVLILRTTVLYHRFFDLGGGWRSGLRLTPSARFLQHTQRPDELFLSESTKIYLEKRGYRRHLTLNYDFGFQLFEGEVVQGKGRQTALRYKDLFTFERTHSLSLDGLIPLESGSSLGGTLHIRYSEGFFNPAFKGYQPSLFVSLRNIPVQGVSRGFLRLTGGLSANLNTEDVGDERARVGLTFIFNYDNISRFGVWNFSYTLSLSQFLNDDSVFGKKRFNHFHSIGTGPTFFLEESIFFSLNFSYMLNRSNIAGARPQAETELVGEQNRSLGNFDQWTTTLSANVAF